MSLRHSHLILLAFGLTISGCSKNSSSNSSTGTGGTAAAAGTSGRLGTGGVNAAAAGSGAAAGAGAANMPNAQCLAGANHMNVPCENCSCTPDAMGGCLDELTACQGASDAMSAMLCGAIIDCATKNKCTGNACITPCMTEITAAAGYMMAAPLTAATNVGTCSMNKCGSVCP